MRILLIDDEPALLFAMHHYLTRDGFEVECAVELEEAQALLSNVTYDAVVTDVRLGEMRHTDGGLHVLSFLRQRGLATPAIVVTGNATTEVVAEAERLGAEAVIRKPASLPMLAETLRGLTEESSC